MSISNRTLFINAYRTLTTIEPYKSRYESFISIHSRYYSRQKSVESQQNNEEQRSLSVITIFCSLCELGSPYPVTNTLFLTPFRKTTLYVP